MAINISRITVRPYGSDLKTDWQPGLEDQPTTGPVRYRKPLRMRTPRFTGIKKIAEGN